MIYETAVFGSNLNVSIGRVSYLATERFSNLFGSCQSTDLLADLTAAQSLGYIRCRCNNSIVRSCRLPYPPADVSHVIAVL